MATPSPTPAPLAGVFAVNKPTGISSAQVILELQRTFSTSQLFAGLLAATRRERAAQEAHQPTGQKRKNEEAEERFFKMGHGGTLDPLASGVLIVGIGRGTKVLSRFLGSRKTYETVVLFGKSTDTYDVDGTVDGEAAYAHIDRGRVERELVRFRGSFEQTPPVYSALKVDGMKAWEYARSGAPLPRELLPREVHVDECTLLEYMPGGTHDWRWPGDTFPAAAPAARIRLTVSSGFYVRSLAHDLGVACGSLATMAALVRTQQASYTISETPDRPDLITAVTYADLNAGEMVWGGQVEKQLTAWAGKNPVPAQRHVNGRDAALRDAADVDSSSKPRQRFRDGWVADSKKERIKQQGGKAKGKYNQPKIHPREVVND